MFIPPNSLKNKLDSTSNVGSKVRLQASHLLIDHEIALDVFGKDFNVNMIYYPEKCTLMIAAKSDELFKKLHKANPHMLKDRNLKGDKTIALHEILIDHDINDLDRDLEFESPKGLGILNVKL